jgi:hypothetical protein
MKSILGAVLVDTWMQRAGLPDSFAKTVPIWCACINRAIDANRRDHLDSPTGVPEFIPVFRNVKFAAPVCHQPGIQFAGTGIHFPERVSVDSVHLSMKTDCVWHSSPQPSEAVPAIVLN